MDDFIGSVPVSRPPGWLQGLDTLVKFIDWSKEFAKSYQVVTNVQLGFSKMNSYLQFVFSLLIGSHYLLQSGRTV